MSTKLVLSDGPHKMTGRCIEVRNPPECVRNALVGAVCNQWTPSDDYQAKQKAGPFIQSNCHNYLLIEMWCGDQDPSIPQEYLKYLQGVVDRAEAEEESNKEPRFARCSSCGWWGEDSELLPDDGPNPHPCGKDECPSCHAKNCICCCLTQEQAEGIDEQEEEVE